MTPDLPFFPPISSAKKKGEPEEHAKYKKSQYGVELDSHCRSWLSSSRGGISEDGPGSEYLPFSAAL